MTSACGQGSAFLRQGLTEGSFSLCGLRSSNDKDVAMLSTSSQIALLLCRLISVQERKMASQKAKEQLLG
jgi:hypothetical protein